MNAARLLEYFDRIAEAPDAVSRLRKFILDLAVRGKLVEQNPSDEPASELLKAIQGQKIRFEKQGVIKSTKKVPLVEDDEVQFSLPSSWLWTRLNDITQYIQRGKSPKYSNEEGPLVISQKCVQWTGLNLGLARYITKESISEYDESRFLRQGDLLWNSTGTGTIGRIVRFALDCDRLVCDSHVTIVRCLLVSPEYVRLWLMSDHVYGNIEELASGSTNQVELTAQMAINQVIPLPPLAEQHRIVAKVDELMVLCDRLEASQAKRESRRDRLASASLKRIGQPEDMGNGEEFRENVRFHLYHLPRLATRPEHVKELRQTILNLAVRGKLVPQDPNDEPASELLNIVSVERKRLLRTKKVRNIRYEDVIREDDQPFPLPVGWSWVRFGDLILDSDSGWSPQTESFPRSGDAWGVLKVSAVSWDEFKPEQNKQLLSGVVPPDSAKVNEGDFLISRANTSELVAKCVIVSSCPDNLIMSDKIVRLYFARECNKYYLKAVNNYADYARIFYSEKSSGTSLSMQNVTRQQIYSLPIPLPPLAEQHRIVAKVDELMNLCDQLEVHLATNQTNQSRLLEATLCDALGVMCLPVSRPSRPAPSLERVVATHSEQPPKPITPRPGPVETPTAAVQGSLVEQPTPQVGKPRAANSGVPGAILAHMEPGQEYSRAQLAEALGLSVYEWNMAIRELKESGRVVQTGERRGARYSVAS